MHFNYAPQRQLRHPKGKVRNPKTNERCIDRPETGRHYKFATMTAFTIILLIFLGLLLLLIEFAVIPGVTIAGIGGFILLGLSVYIAFAEYGTGIGFITL